MRVDIYLTNLTKEKLSVGMTTLEPGETEKILQKDFERKASYIDRMIKEGRLSFGNSGKSAPADILVEPTVEGANTGSQDEAKNAGDDTKEETQTSEADASKDEATQEVAKEEAAETEADSKDEETSIEVTDQEAKEEPKIVEEVPAPKRSQKKK